MSHKTGSSTAEVRSWLVAAHRDLREHADILNDLNVFPVADADTGANLGATLGIAAEAAQLIEGKDVGELLTYAGQAALEQARGNSGVLAAVTLTAMGSAVEGCTRLTAAQLKAALVAAQVRCRSAITEPVPGTMISVLQAASDVPVPDTAAEGSNQQLTEWLDRVVAASAQAVTDTVAQIPVLTERGTVDSGALGMLIILCALREQLGGDEAPMDYVDDIVRHHSQPATSRPEQQADGFEVMGTVDLTALEAAELRHELDDAGDSVIVSAVSETEDGITWRVHVHVADPDVALELIQRRGKAPRSVTVTSLAAEAE